MSAWTYITGTITVRPLGRTQPEKRYVLDTVLAHLPQVTGSERNMSVYVIRKDGYTSSCTHNEFGEYSNVNRKNGWFRTQNEYIVVVDATLRDRDIQTTHKEFQKCLASCPISMRR